MDPSDFTLYESSPSRQPLPLCPGGGNESPTSVNQQNLLNPFPEARTAASRVVFPTNFIGSYTGQIGNAEDSLR